MIMNSYNLGGQAAYCKAKEEGEEVSQNDIHR